MAILGVILAGGVGRRLDPAVAKPRIELGGVPLIERAVRTLEASCDAIVVTAPASAHAALAPLPPRARFVADPDGMQGPLAGLVAGLSARDFDEALVLGVDFPLATPAFFERLLHLLRGRPDAPAVVPMPGGIPQPLAAVYRPTARERLAERLAAGERSATRAVAALDPLWVDDGALSDEDRDALFNVNTPDDRTEAERRMRLPRVS